jgi:hypothetical protein
MELKWEEPYSSGGDAILKYIVEYWENEPGMYGNLEVQVIRFVNTAEGVQFFIEFGAEKHTIPLEVGASAKSVQETVEALAGVGGVAVEIIHGTDTVDYSLTFLDNIAPVNVVTISGSSLSLDSFCVCAKSTNTCVMGTLSQGCEASITSVGTIVTQTIEVQLDDATTNETEFRQSVTNLVQDSAINDGFGVRVYAVNSRGAGNACQAVFDKPMNVPDSPSMVELTRDPSSPSALIVYFTADLYPEDRGSPIHSYIIEYSDGESSFAESQKVTLPIESLLSARMPSFRGAGKAYLQYTLVEERVTLSLSGFRKSNHSC